MPLVRTERGWAGHLIVSARCGFRRNTLLEYRDRRIVVSTVGAYCPRDGEIDTIGFDRYYETMAFEAKYDGTYWDANVDEEVFFESDWAISDAEFDADQRANTMHEAVVAEIAERMRKE